MHTHDPSKGTNPDLWDFPCTIAFKTMAAKRPNIENDVISAIQSVVSGDYSPTSKPSAKGNYLSITVKVTLANKDQVEALYAAVRAVDDVRICL
ncbi:MAG: DUF493 family protein YbeD [Kangiellaceae bacterium]|jgi:putative lipoic acid-binding regulatory protein|nr:DUF493 family protein YbeD [Kangiellaceae bacterium]